MAEQLAAQRVPLDGRIVSDGVRRAFAWSEEPILCVAKADSLSFVAVSGVRLVAAWEYRLRTPVNRPAVFVIPPMIVGHLMVAPGPSSGPVELMLDGSRVALLMRDQMGDYELHWRSDPHTFPAPPELNRLLTLPDKFVRLKYLDLSDSVHQAVVQVVEMEEVHQIHRTRLAIMVHVSNGDLSITGQEIDPREKDQHYFDPRLMIRALELTKSEHVEVGLTCLGPCSSFLSVVDRQGERLIHCALLSIGLDTERLVPLPRGRRR